MSNCPESFFLCGGSWASAFHIGVYKAMIELWGYDALSKIRIGGNSAGSPLALGIALGLKWEELESIYIELSEQAMTNGVFGKMTDYHIIMLNRLLKNSDDFEKVNNRLYIGITYFINKFELISEWKNNKELIDTLHASFHIPFYCSYLNPVKGKIGIDGSFGKCYYKFNELTVVVNPVSDYIGEIVCDPPLNLSDCYNAPNTERYMYMKNKGYEAMINWDNNYKYYNNYNKGIIFILILWLLRYIESFINIHLMHIRSLFLG